MSAQPLNTSIAVYQRVRSYRKALRHDSVAALIKRLRPLIMSVPGKEVLVGVLTRDTTVKDFSPYCGEASATATRGFPIVVGLLDELSFAAAQENTTGVDFALTIGQDKFLQNASASLSRDLHGDLRTVLASDGTNP